MLRTTVNSFDMFDTLVARRCVTPVALFAEVEAACGVPGFALARRAAEFALADRRVAFDIHDIYAALVDAGTLAATDAERLKGAEIDAEFDNALPITENLRRVQPGDLVVSDMYLPHDVLRRMLQHVGLRTPVRLFASNLGKHFGDIWADLGQRWIIASHLGDNPHSDVVVPGQLGIPATHYTGAQPSAIEERIAAAGFPTLARVARATRLRDPHAANSESAAVWNLCSQLNLPLLVVGAELLRRQREATDARIVLFSARDCYLLSEVFSTLFPATPADYVFVSREALERGSAALRSYLGQFGLDRALVCDMASTGASWHRFLGASGRRTGFFCLVFIDNWALAKVAPDVVAASPHMRFAWGVRSSTLAHYSTAIEVLNCAPHPSCRDLESVGRFHSPVLQDDSEIPPVVTGAVLQHQAFALELLRELRNGLLAELAVADPLPLIHALVETISRSELLTHYGRLLRWPPHSGPPTT